MRELFGFVAFSGIDVANLSVVLGDVVWLDQFDVECSSVESRKKGH